MFESSRRECPVCQAPMEEIVRYVTECCGAERIEGEDRCPLCGAFNPIVVAAEPSFACASCGYHGNWQRPL